MNNTVGCTWALTQSSTESSQQQFSPCSHLLFPLSFRLFPLSRCQDAPGSFATSSSLCWSVCLYIWASWVALGHRFFWSTPSVQHCLEPNHKSLHLDRYKYLWSAWSCLWRGNSYVKLAGNTDVFVYFLNSCVCIPGFIVSVQPQGKCKDFFPNKSAQLIEKQCCVTGGGVGGVVLQNLRLTR